MFQLPSDDSSDSTHSESPPLSPGTAQSQNTPQAPTTTQPTANRIVDEHTAHLRALFLHESQRTAVADRATFLEREQAREEGIYERPSYPFELDELIAATTPRDRNGSEPFDSEPFDSALSALEPPTTELPTLALNALELPNIGHTNRGHDNAIELLVTMETPELDRIPMITNGRLPSMDLPPLDNGTPDVPPRRHDHLHPRPTMHYFSTGTSSPYSDADSAMVPEFRNPFPPMPLPTNRSPLSLPPRRTSSFAGSSGVQRNEMRRKHAELVASLVDAREEMTPDAVRSWHRDSLLLVHPRLNCGAANEEFEKVLRQNRRSLRRSSSL
ncbi:hypothetical protein TI39_contig334g00009 [Zymoseptoria brevis]|uniref:Uncharacterized protein n=1 Tax=Zymoseptoria brevis TaxID=1047168 RepID=A0A0F4GTI1_9PEZI|nr:hypothetical protein TI39_contig334g00009 [Zymoseptoria brevis]